MSDARAIAWELARALDRGSSPWMLERMKACLDGGIPRSHPARGLAAVFEGMRFVAAAAVAISVLAWCLLRASGRSDPLPRGARAVVAVHGEWTNRTRHLLARVGHDLDPDALVVLGRPERPLAALRAEWTGRVGRPLPPMLVPLSWAAARDAWPDLRRLLAEGWSVDRAMPDPMPFRSRAAIAFRVMLGAVEAAWWRRTGARDLRVVFGHTGTADTTQLERQMQAQGCRTVHAVHGLCDGPNFVGFSDAAYFKCGADARRHAAFGQYGECLAPAATPVEPLAGGQGLLLLTNLAHPMRPGYRERGLADELAVLGSVARAAQEAGPLALPMRWKPHPTIDRLPPQERLRLRDTARRLGFEEVADLGGMARAARRVLTTPSSAVLEVLTLGRLPRLIAIPGEAMHDAFAELPGVIRSDAAIAAALRGEGAEGAEAEGFRLAWARCAPAREPTAVELLGRAAG